MAETKYFEHELQLSKASEPASISFPARLAYRTFGDASKPAVVLPSCYGGTLDTTTPFLYSTNDGNEPVFPPSRFFVVVCGLLGGSESSSPSNQPAPFDGPRFPHVTYEDNINLQHALCQELGIQKLFAYIGFSMGGQQAYHMSVMFPEFVEHVVVLAGSARTSWHNWSFLEGPKAALVNSADFEGGHYSKPATKGTGAFGRVYSTWALSQEWYRQQCWERLGFASLPDYLDQAWEKGLGGWDANNLLCLLWTWQHGDVTRLHPGDKGDLSKTLARIKARCLVMPSRSDTYFPPEDNAAEVQYLAQGKLSIIESIWGHLAGGGGGTTQDTSFIQDQIKAFVR